jgi:hypothetical protein
MFAKLVKVERKTKRIYSFFYQEAPNTGEAKISYE